MIAPIPLVDVRDESAFGGKAAQLGAALRAGLPVPNGFALDSAAVEAIVAGDVSACAAAAEARSRLGGSVAVRSSAVGEDSADASFAGLHRTLLYVGDGDAFREAIADVRASAHTEGARAYRARLGLPATPTIGVVVQRMVDADRAGVLFTRDPITGRDELVIESAWGLGEAIVAGLLTPDRHRVARAGHILERILGDKDVELRAGADGVEERPVAASRAASLCLSDEDVHCIHELAGACERAFGDAPADIEWAFVGNDLFLLQRRKITR
jgi:pyruvate,water dikinase